MKKKNNKNSNNTESDKPNIINFYNNPEIISLIVDLKTSIDNSFKNFEEKILELAEKVSKSKFEISKISYIIKNILKDEIKDGKITERYIEKCLPPEYKRKYQKKTEFFPLSKEKENSPLLVMDNMGNSSAVNTQDAYNDSSKNDPNYSNNQELTKSDFLNPELIRKNNEPKDIEEKTPVFQSNTTNLKLILFPKEKLDELIDVSKKSNSVILIRVNTKGIIESIEPDTNRDQIADEDTINDNYT